MKVEEEEEEVVVVVAVVVELRAQEGSLVRSCMSGSIQCVHVVNMKASILYAQQTAGFSWREALLLVQPKDGTQLVTHKQDGDTNTKQMASSGITVPNSTAQKYTSTPKEGN